MSKMKRRTLGLTMGAVFALTACGTEGLEPAQPTVEADAMERVDAQAADAKPVDIIAMEKQLKEASLVPPEPCTDPSCEPGGGGGDPDWPYYTLFWRANLLSLRCISVSDMDGKDELRLESEVTGDHQSDIIWSNDYAYPGTVFTFNPLDPYPTSLQFSTQSVGAGGKLVALWDKSEHFLDLEQQIGWTALRGQTGTFTAILEGNDGKYELTYQVQSTGCSPHSQPCPTNL
ncbi:hypothetical protein [Corallococcus macrosporus]|uniref:Putative lipoprotein n=1 Tax=Myxococcus fulvus (strain ATCC BAA-855 / HW-1) TaxID=483219 RepID=F8CPZ7_MYXFH|nr:hypothetical protein [Corallococcus macrosporus]AEI63020.1 putative lipoprotein [Corallococcus macrosporus]